MKIIVFSDSHRDIKPMTDVVEIMKPDMIIHLGDHIYDAVELRRQFMDIPMEFVKGNCDLGSSAPAYKSVTVGNKKIFMAHGDNFGVRSGTSGILKEGRKRNADIILFGHTHHPIVKHKKETIIMNPGRIGRMARGLWQPSFGVIEIGKEVNCYTVDYEYIIKNPI